MNKDNYIRLLEKENQEYFEKAIKTMKDCCCHEIPELNGEINELLDDLNDLRADWAADHTEYRKTLESLKSQNTRECDLNARLQAFMDGIDRQAEELDEKDRIIRDLEEQISNLKAAVAPKASAPPYAPDYKRNGGK